MQLSRPIRRSLFASSFFFLRSVGLNAILRGEKNFLSLSVSLYLMSRQGQRENVVRLIP